MLHIKWNIYNVPCIIQYIMNMLTLSGHVRFKLSSAYNKFEF